MRVVVIGAGIGGLAVAIRLAAAGHEVVVLERSTAVGGKVATLDLDGYRFDLGPATLTQPSVFDDLLHIAGSSLSDEIELVALDPHGRYLWPDGSRLDTQDDEPAWRRELDRFSQGAAAAWQRFDERAERIWLEARSSFFAAPVEVGRTVLGKQRSSIDLDALDARRSLADVTAEHFQDPRLQQFVNHYASAVGASPYRAPATFAYLAHVERAAGVWHVVGGIGRLRDALERAAVRVGAVLRCATDAGRVVAEGGRVRAVELADGGRLPADVVVAGVDAAHLYTELVPDPKRARALDKAKRSMSGFLVCAAVRGRTEGVAHRTVWFPLRDRAEYERLERGFPALDPTVSAVVSSVTDPSMAPRDCENWYLLIQTPSAIGLDRKMTTAAVLNRIAERGFDIRHRIEFTRTLLPADFDARYRAHGGSFHGTSSDDAAAALHRPSNIGPVDGLYLVGGSTHPGGGLASVAHSARIVAGLVAERGG